jgi:hypothetical protein
MMQIDQELAGDGLEPRRDKQQTRDGQRVELVEQWAAQMICSSQGCWWCQEHGENPLESFLSGLGKESSMTPAEKESYSDSLGQQPSQQPPSNVQPAMTAKQPRDRQEQV